MISTKLFESSTIVSKHNIDHHYENCCQYSCLENDLSLSSISKSFSDEELSKAVKSLVMSRYGDEFTKRFEKSVLRQSKRYANSSGFSSQGSSSNDSASYQEVDFSDNSIHIETSTPNKPAVVISSKTFNVATKSTPKKTFSTHANSTEPTSCSVSAISDLLSLKSDQIEDAALRTAQYEFLKQHDSVETIEKIMNYTNSRLIDGDIFDPELIQLNKELILQEAHIQQIAKLIYAVKRDISSSARLEAEKMLLIKTLTKEMLLEKMRSNKRNESWNVGRISLFNINFRIKPINNSKFFFFCVLWTNSEIYSTDIVTPESNGVVKFDNNFQLDDLAIDFKIKIQIYYGIKQEDLHQKKKLTKKSQKMFHLWGETLIGIENINKSKTHQNKTSLPKLVVNVDGFAEIKKTMLAAGFLQVGERNKSNVILWNRFWLVLYGSQLSFYINPIDVVFNKCIKSIDFINFDKRIQVTIPSRAECPRNRTICIDFVDDGRKIEWFLTFESDVELTFWHKAISRVVLVVQLWGNLFK